MTGRVWGRQPPGVPNRVVRVGVSYPAGYDAAVYCAATYKAAYTNPASAVYGVSQGSDTVEHILPSSVKHEISLAARTAQDALGA